MLVVHDTVAQKNFDPVLPPLPDNFDDDFDEESVKIVRLVKNKEPLVRIRSSTSSHNILCWKGVTVNTEEVHEGHHQGFYRKWECFELYMLK